MKRIPSSAVYLSFSLLFVFTVLAKLTFNPYQKHPLDCEHKVRFGDSYGGWVTCAPRIPLKGRLVYTIGIGRNIEWDKEMIQTHGTIHHGWDPTPTAEDFFQKKPPPEGFHFHKFGLGVRDGNVSLKLPLGNFDSYTVMDYHEEARPGTVVSVPMLSLSSMLQSLRHSQLAILKIDIEGAEFEVIRQWRDSRSSIPADQILIEFHERYFPHRKNLVGDAINEMEELGFDMVHRTKLECTFAKRSKYETKS